MRCAVSALTLFFAFGVALAADLEVNRPDRPAPAQRLQSSDPAEKRSDDTRLDNLQKPEAEAPKGDESWWHKLVREAPNCKSFTDGCRTCSSSHVCSNIGIACQPKEWSCNDAKQ
jgi:hypothetical protein